MHIACCRLSSPVTQYGTVRYGTVRYVTVCTVCSVCTDPAVCTDRTVVRTQVRMYVGTY